MANTISLIQTPTLSTQLVSLMEVDTVAMLEEETQKSPKPVVTVESNRPDYRGESVTFRCDINGGGTTEWTYEWFKDNNPVSPSHTTQKITVEYDRGEYTCRGTRSDYQYSQISDPVTLSVSEKPQPVITSSPKGDVLTGNSVTLTCTLNMQSAGWKFYWITPTQSTETETGTHSYTIRSVRVSDGGQYRCRAGRGNPVYYTHYSDALWVNVTEIKPVVIIKPYTQVYRGETVTFRCNIQTGDTEWTYSWYKNDNTKLQDTTQELIISSVRDSDGGKYTCRGRRRDSQLSQISDPVTLSVSEKPKPVLTSDLNGAALTGNSVTLTCTLKLQSAGWKFYWITPTQSTETETETHSYAIRSVRVSDGGQYRCRAGRGNPVYYTHHSDALWVNVTEIKPVVIIKPYTQVYRGETVTFRCDIQTGDTEWTYSWYKNDNTKLQDTTQELIISSVRDSDGGKYTCRGRRRDSQLSQISDPVTLSVSEKPKPVLTSDLNGAALTGNSVTLTCTLKLQSAGWKFYWITPTQSTETDTHSYTIRSVRVSDGGQYKCRAGRGNPVYYTHHSDALWVNVTEIKPVVIIKPYTQVYRGETVTFRCNIQTGDTEWTYSWYKNDNTKLQDTTQELIISSVRDSDGGKYTCRGRRRDSQLSQISDPVTLSVSEKPKPVVTSSPKGDVLTGNSVTLTCTLNVQSDGWKFYWITPTQSTETETETHSYTIRSVSVSDGGQYRCRAGRGNPVYYTHYSDALWVKVTVSPKPVVIIKPDTQVYRGETVTFRCNIQTGGDTEWTYEWYRDGHTISPYSTAQEFTGYYSSVKYTCRGRRRDSQLSEISDPVTLSVSEKPKAVITSSPKGDVLSGNSVTLTCTLNVQSVGWKFYWITPTQSTETETAAQYYYSYSYSHHYIRSVSVSDGGQYKCRAGRGDPVYYTHYSDALWVKVTEIKPVVIIKPDTQVYRGERVTFRCNIQTGGDTEWTYEWYRDGKTFYPYSTAQEFTDNYYSSGKYTCRGRRRDSQLSQISDPLTLSVSEKPEPVITSSPEGDVLTGNSVTLTCTLNVQSAGWKFYWIKDSQYLKTETETNSYTINPVSVSDRGRYSCYARRENAEYSTYPSDELWVNVIGE
ncbi:sialoadhesin-like [Clarias gariepinus]